MKDYFFELPDVHIDLVMENYYNGTHNVTHIDFGGQV
jgi:hypothetical protein